MKNQLFTFIVCLFCLSCATNPFTGKKTMAFMPNTQLLPMAFAEYDKFLSEHKVIKGTPDAEMITRVGQRISVSAERWLDANNHQGYLKDYKWEYNLVDDKAVNAWCMPGGKIVFYTGILPIAKNEAAIAAIMGHEVAHALANHGQQRMSAGMIQQGVGVGVAIATKDKSAQNKICGCKHLRLALLLEGCCLLVERHETEADEIGLYLTAIAGIQSR